ncbi:BTAD domain-containing putative transcriptional regulator [Chloroflexus sp.]|uniref:BTAD domain-containing putative transcriptional regulator n=1 Tax=Chloroflexus sp. TaxID=1904827 RepID=UPI002ACDE707|nr:BTAD domain-containing putative transcriptional regulator [Chloroflexus sp.]
MTEWHIQLLGGFDVRRDGVSLNSAFQTDSARLLFAWLCLNQRQAVRRETLANLLWSDRPQSVAQNTLRVTLSRIRKALGNDHHVLRTEPATVTLDLPSSWQVDALDFTQAVAAVRNHSHRSAAGCPSCQAHVRAAATLYRGAFLAGISPESELFLEWSTHQGEAMHRAAIEVFGHLAERALREGDWPAAQSYAGQQLHLELWHEAAHRQLMRALAQQGQRAAALAHYQTCCDILQREFGIEPEAETQHLASTIRAGHLTNATSLPSQRQAAAIDQLPLIGRASEVETLAGWLNQPDMQLISVVGAGGIGKTRLAMRAAHLMQYAFRDGVRYIFLHPEDDAAIANKDAAEHVARAIAAACHIELNDRQPVPEQVIAALQTRAYLLVFDSFEHVAAANLFVNELLEAAPYCVALITARQPLHLRREQVLKVRPLSTAITAEGLSPSAQMFIELAERSGIAFSGRMAIDDIEHICADLDGLPLGIELAAASLYSMSLPALRQTVEQSIKTLRSPLADTPARHRSLTAIFVSTWQTLTERSRQALAMLSIVRAPCLIEAAQAITGDAPALDELFDLALVRRLDDSTVWLHEHIHQLASEKLAGDFGHELANEAARRHAHWFLGWLAGSYHAMQGAESFAVRERLIASLNDIEAAWRWALAHSEWDLASAAAPAYEDLFYLSGRLVDGLERIQQSLAYVSHPNQPASQRLRVHLLLAQGLLQRYRSGGPAIEAMLHEAVRLAEQMVDPLLLAQTLLRLGIIENAGSYKETGRATLDRLRAVLDQSVPADSLDVLAIESTYWRLLSWCELHAGHNELAKEYAQKALDLAGKADHYLMLARCNETLSNVVNAQGDFAGSEYYLQQALAIYQRLRLTYHQTNVLDLLAQNADACGDYGQAQRYYWQELALARECGNRDAELVAHINLGISYDQMGHYERALAHTQIALALSDKVGNQKHHTVVLANLSLHAHHNQRHELALDYARTATQQAAHLLDLQAYGYDFQGHALLALGRIDEAEQAYTQAKALRQRLNYHTLVLESQAGLIRVALARNDLPEALRRAAPIVEHLLAGGNLYGTEETLRIYWTAYQVLEANRDPRAQAILDLGRALVQERASRLSDPASRTIYLNADVNRLIMAAGQPSSLRQPTAA